MTDNEKLEVDRTVEDECKKTTDEEAQKKSDNGKDEKKEAKKDDEKALRELEFYHGYVSREDLGSLLKAEGDFLVRMTEVEGQKTANKELVLSLMISAAGTGEENTNQDYQTLAGVLADVKNLKARNVVIRRTGGQYRIEGTKQFKTVRDLVEFYKKNQGQVNKTCKFQLRNSVNQQPWEYAHEDVKFTGKVLGEGAYGMVKAGTLNQKKKGSNSNSVVNVAVKMAKGTSDLSKAKIKEMMREARLMRNLSHKNVVKLYGVAVLEQPLYIILELIQGGELKAYLKAHAGKVDTMEKLKMCQGAASGLEYLHKQGYIHRDIAARNCLYTDDRIVKISDFGLSRHCPEYKIKTNMKLPIKWLSPETIEKFTFTMKSDVYSFGILIFEIFADGGEAWPGVINGEVKKKVLSGVFLEIPSSAPSRLRTFAGERIFQKEPNNRAPMTEVSQFMDSLIANPDVPEQRSKSKTGKDGRKQQKTTD